MTAEKFYDTLKKRFCDILAQCESDNGCAVQEEQVNIVCRSLTPEEAIGQTKRKDFPIITGKDVMIQAEFRGFLGQAFTDAPTAFSGTISEVLDMDITGDPYARSLFIAVLNAVMASLGKCTGTVHCRTNGPENCAKDMRNFLESNYPEDTRIALIGYQPALLDMLAHSNYKVRVLDLNPENIGQESYGVMVEDGRSAYESIIHGGADLILCTGSTICNGTIVDYLDLDTEVLFFGTSISGAAPLMGLKRVCFAAEYEGDSNE